MNTVIDTLNAWGERGGAFALPMLLQSSLLIVLLFLLDSALRKRVSAAFRSALWLLLLVKLVLPPSLALPTGIGYWIGRTTNQSPPIATVTQVRVTYSDKAPLVRVAPATPAPLPAISVGSFGWLALGWLAGSLALLALLLHRGRVVAKLLRQAEPASAELQQLLDDCRKQLRLRSAVQLRISLYALSPALCGLFKPVVLLPQALVGRLNSTQLRAVLLHELIHLRRRDLWTNHAQTLLQVAYWWHPLLWLANARLRRVREEAVDEAVMAVLHPDNEVYPETLLEVAKACLTRPRLSLGLVGIIESRSALRQRIELALNRIGSPQERLHLSGLAALLLVAALSIPMGCKAPTVRLEAGPTRVRSVDPDEFLKELRRRTGEDASRLPEAKLQEVVRRYFVKAGVKPENAQRIFFDRAAGKLIVSIPSPEDEAAWSAVLELQPLHYQPQRKPSERRQAEGADSAPNITIESRIAEFRATVLGDLHLGAPTGIWTNGSTVQLEHGRSVTANTNNLSYWVLSPQRTAELIHRIEQKDGTDVLYAPRVTTLDGRQAQVVVADLLDIRGLSKDGQKRGPMFQPVTIEGVGNVEVGPKLDFLPRITKDKTGIEITLIASLKEFQGYAPPKETPIPQFRTRQFLTRVTVKDGETVLLGGEAPPADAPKDSKVLIVLVTPTLVDAAGNKIHE